MSIKFLDISFSLGSNVISNESLEISNPDWNMKKISEKTGVYQRHHAKFPEEDVISLAEKSVNKISSKLLAKVKKLIFVTQTPPRTLPNCSSLIQYKNKLDNDLMAFDISLGCSGFVYALFNMSKILDLDEIGLIVCCENYSKYILPDDRSMISLFSDASSATVITKHTISENVIDFDFGTDGSGYDKLIINEDKHKNNYLSMSGADIFLFTLDVIPNSINKILSRNKLKISDIDHFFFHQASKLVLDNLIRNLNIVDQTKVYSNINIYGNTVSSSIPILLKDAMSKNLLKKGDRILLSGFGVGLSWGSLIIQW